MSITPEKPIRIAIVEDEPLWQQGIQALLLSRSAFTVVGVYADADAALGGIQSNTADIILMDWKLPGVLNGLDIARVLLERGVQAHQIILITGSPLEQLKSELPNLPYGYVSKPAIASDLLTAIDAAVARFA